MAAPVARARKCASGSGVPPDPPQMARLWGCCAPNMIQKCPFFEDLPIAKRSGINRIPSSQKNARAPAGIVPDPHAPFDLSRRFWGWKRDARFTAFFLCMGVLAFAAGLQYRERKFPIPNAAAGPFLPGALKMRR